MRIHYGDTRCARSFPASVLVSAGPEGVVPLPRFAPEPWRVLCSDCAYVGDVRPLPDACPRCGAFFIERRTAATTPPDDLHRVMIRNVTLPDLLAAAHAGGFPIATPDPLYSAMSTLYNFARDTR